MRIFFKNILRGVNVILVISLIIVCGIHVKRRMDNAVSSFETRRESERKEVERVKSVAKVSTQSTQKELKWELFWEKSPDVSGGDPKLRTFNSEVRILTNDTSHFVFIQYYNWEGRIEEAHFFWDKTKTYGVWSQDRPKDGGRWWLAPTPRSKNRYHGGQSDRRSSKFIPMWLVGQ